MAIEKLDYATAVIEALQGAYRQDWCLTNWTGTGKPLLPAGMIISILGYPYLVSGGDETPADPASDGAVYLKITPDAPAGATATAEYVNTFSGTWSESYNGFYDGDSLFLNVFMTKAGAVWSAKGTWLNFRERKLALINDGLSIGNLIAVDANLSGNLSIGGYVTSDLGLDIIMSVGAEKFKIDTVNVSHTGDLNWFKMKEYKVYGHGVIRVKYTVDIAPAGANRVSNAAIYVNGVLAGINHTINTSSSAYSHDTFTEDIPISRGDLVQIYIKLNSSINYNINVSLVELSCDIALSNLALDYVVE